MLYEQFLEYLVLNLDTWPNQCLNITNYNQGYNNDNRLLYPCAKHMHTMIHVLKNVFKKDSYNIIAQFSFFDHKQLED